MDSIQLKCRHLQLTRLTNVDAVFKCQFPKKNRQLSKEAVTHGQTLPQKSERERERERARARDRERDRQRDRERQRQREQQRETERQADRQRQSARAHVRKRDRERENLRARDRERKRENAPAGEASARGQLPPLRPPSSHEAVCKKAPKISKRPHKFHKGPISFAKRPHKFQLPAKRPHKFQKAPQNHAKWPHKFRAMASLAPSIFSWSCLQKKENGGAFACLKEGPLHVLHPKEGERLVYQSGNTTTSHQ